MNDEMCEVLNPDLWTEMHYAKEISGCNSDNGCCSAIFHRTELQ